MKLRNSLEGHEGQVLCCCFGPEGRRVATGGRDKSIAIWALRGGRLERALVGHSRTVSAMAFTAADELVSGDVGGAVCVWSWPRGKQLLALEGLEGAIYTLGSSADGSLIAAGSADRTIGVWSRETGELLHRFAVGARGMSFVFSGDGEHVVSGRGGDTLCFWSLESGQLVWEQAAGPGTVGAFELDCSREWVVSRGIRGPITIWSSGNWAYTAVLPIIEKGLTSAKLRPGHEQLACVWEHSVGVFDAETGGLIDSAEIESKGVHDLDVSPDGRYLVTASADGLVRIWDLD